MADATNGHRSASDTEQRQSGAKMCVLTRGQTFGEGIFQFGSEFD